MILSIPDVRFETLNLPLQYWDQVRAAQLMTMHFLRRA